TVFSTGTTATAGSTIWLKFLLTWLPGRRYGRDDTTDGPGLAGRPSAPPNSGDGHQPAFFFGSSNFFASSVNFFASSVNFFAWSAAFIVVSTTWLVVSFTAVVKLAWASFARVANSSARARSFSLSAVVSSTCLEKKSAGVCAA